MIPFFLILRRIFATRAAWSNLNTVYFILCFPEYKFTFIVKLPLPPTTIRYFLSAGLS